MAVYGTAEEVAARCSRHRFSPHRPVIAATLARIRRRRSVDLAMLLANAAQTKDWDQEVISRSSRAAPRKARSLSTISGSSRVNSGFG